MLVFLHIEEIELCHERVISNLLRYTVRVFDLLLTVCDVIDDLFELWSLA